MKRSKNFLLASVGLALALATTPALAGGKGHFHHSRGNQSQSTGKSIVSTPRTSMMKSAVKFSGNKLSSNKLGNLKSKTIMPVNNSRWNSAATKINHNQFGKIAGTKVLNPGQGKISPIGKFPGKVVNRGKVLNPGKIGPIVDSGKSPFPGKFPGKVIDPGKVVGTGKFPGQFPGTVIAPGTVIDPGPMNPLPPSKWPFPGGIKPPFNPNPQPPVDPTTPPSMPPTTPPTTPPCNPPCNPPHCGGGLGLPYFPFPGLGGGYYGGYGPGYGGGYCGTTTIVQPVATPVTVVSDDTATVQPAMASVDLELMEVRQLDRGDAARDWARPIA